EQGIASLLQIYLESGVVRWRLPIFKPAPLAGDDVHQRVAHGTKAAAQIARELLRAERGDSPQNPVVRPTVVFIEQLNVVFSHGDESTRLIFLPLPIENNPDIL